MTKLVLLEVSVRKEALSTHLAAELLFSFVYSHVTSHVCIVRKGFAATRQITTKWLKALVLFFVFIESVFVSVQTAAV